MKTIATISLLLLAGSVQAQPVALKDVPMDRAFMFGSKVTMMDNIAFPWVKRPPFGRTVTEVRVLEVGKGRDRDTWFGANYWADGRWIDWDTVVELLPGTREPFPPYRPAR